MSSLKPITLHGHPGPNPWKVAILLEELDLPYTTKLRTTPELKKPEFLALNRNRMSPVIEDPNTNLLLAESGAIMEYVLEQYDAEKRISFSAIRETYLMKQWLQFQTTTQGPTLQHVLHFGPVFKQQNNPPARAVHVKDFRHVLQVLDNELSEHGGWLVGGKCSAADLSFVPFHSRLDFIMAGDKPDMATEYPHVDAWYKQMLERETVKKVMANHQAALKSATFPTDKKA